MHVRNVALVGAVMLGIAACDAAAPEQKPVSGLRDDVKYKAAVKEKSHQERTSKQECSRRVNGVCKSWRTVKGWKKVVDRASKPALYCVELDNVNGSRSDDDVWYTVNAGTYYKAVAKDEGDSIKFKPVHGGCW